MTQTNAELRYARALDEMRHKGRISDAQVNALRQQYTVELMKGDEEAAQKVRDRLHVELDVSLDLIATTYELIKGASRK